MRCAIALLVLSGCDVFFPLQVRPPGDGDGDGGVNDGNDATDAAITTACNANVPVFTAAPVTVAANVTDFGVFSNEQFVILLNGMDVDYLELPDMTHKATTGIPRASYSSVVVAPDASAVFLTRSGI